MSEYIQTERLDYGSPTYLIGQQVNQQRAYVREWKEKVKRVQSELDDHEAKLARFEEAFKRIKDI